MCWSQGRAWKVILYQQAPSLQKNLTWINNHLESLTNIAYLFTLKTKSGCLWFNLFFEHRYQTSLKRTSIDCRFLWYKRYTICKNVGIAVICSISVCVCNTLLYVEIYKPYKKENIEFVFFFLFPSMALIILFFFCTGRNKICLDIM